MVPDSKAAIGRGGWEVSDEVIWTQWQVTAYTGKNRNINLGHTFVRAYTEQQAMELGKRALRMTGVRGSYRVSATRYFPWLDFAMVGFVSKADQ